MFNVPALMVVIFVKLLPPLNVSVPAPILFNPPLPVMMPLNAISCAAPAASAALMLKPALATVIFSALDQLAFAPSVPRGGRQKRP